MDRGPSGPAAKSVPGKDILATLSVRFDNGYEADLNVCCGHNVWIDGVLFDADGNEVAVHGPESETINGDWTWEVGGTRYTLTISVDDTEHSALRRTVIK